MNQLEIESRLRDAVRLFRHRDALLLEYDAGERAVAAKIAFYLASIFPEHDVDVEYNRHGLDPKDLDLPADCHGGGKKLIVPGVIVHRRGHDRDNVLVIEIKKETTPESPACDRAKIEGLKRHYHYACGVLLDMPAGPDARNREPRMEWL